MTVNELISKLQDVSDKFGDCDLTINIGGSSFRNVDVRVSGFSGFTDATIVCSPSDTRQAFYAQLFDTRNSSVHSRCHKCLYSNNCTETDADGNCKKYKLDPPDGGYYG